MTAKIVDLKTTDLGRDIEFTATFSDGVTVVARRRGRGLPARQYFAQPRIYGALDALVPDAMAAEPHVGRFIPVDPKTEDDKAAAKEWSAWKRRTLKLGKAALMPYLHALADATYIPDADVTFSQKAGCSCGCSPAFIAKVGGLGRLDYFFDAPSAK